MKFEDIYALPGKPAEFNSMTEPLRPNWFPELPEFYNCSYDDEMLTRLAEEGRVAVKVHGYDYGDSIRWAQLASVWFDGKPVALFQDAGRSGKDHRRRWVTDVEAFKQLLAYLRSRIPLEVTEDVVDPGREVYADEVLEFYGINFGERLGVETPKRLDGVHLVRGDNIPDIPLPAGVHLLAFQAEVEPPALVRRGEHHLKQVEDLTGTLQWKNSHVKHLLEGRGHTKAFSYAEVAQAELSAGAAVVRI